MKIIVKGLTGKNEIIDAEENDPFWKFQARYSISSKTPFDMLKFIYNGKSLLKFNTFFQSLKDLNITEDTMIFLVLRFGGPQPEERAVFNYLAKTTQGLETPSFETLKKLFSDDRIDIECPICLSYKVNRVLSCGEHGMCIECFNDLPKKQCPFCEKYPVTIL